jgi:ribonuclease R
MSENKIYEGTITVTRRGIGFFTYDPVEEDLLIPRESLNTAFPGDTVKVALDGFIESPSRGGKPGGKRKAGKVLEVVSRGRTEFVGLLDIDDRVGIILHPDWKKMYIPFSVEGNNLPLGHKALVKFIGWTAGDELPKATFMEDIGPAGEHETEMRALALASGFENDFPPGVERDAKELEQTGQQLLIQGTSERLTNGGIGRDFRDVTTFTIDPADAKDFDDAISVRKLDNGHTEVGVHIADVSYFVRAGSQIDDEARKRATSVYLVDRTIPMLPHVLSNGLCSLNPDEDRLAVSAVFTLDENAGIIDKWFGETVIHSDKRFSYEEAQGVLDAGTGVLHDDLVMVKKLADKIRERRIKNGAVEFDTPEVKVILDDNGKPIAIKLKERQATNLLIEDFMLLANVAVAEYVAENVKKAGGSTSGIYRIHNDPDADRIENLSQFLKVMGYDLKMKGHKVTGAELNALIAQVKGTPEEYLIKTATLRSMAKAVYGTKNDGHFGLGFDHYTHFTSPIRRYPDLIIHRLLKHFAHGEPVPKQETDDMDYMAKHSSEREVAAAEAERDSVKLKIVEFMSDKVGEEFDGVISGVNDRGVYVELNETHAEGMIRIRDLGDDYYTYDERRYRLVGERMKKEFALGDPIRVKLMAARIVDRELDFAIATP